MDLRSKPISRLPDAEHHRRELNRRLRLAFLAGAEEHFRRTLGRPLTPDELERVLGRYPGDVPEA